MSDRKKPLTYEEPQDAALSDDELDGVAGGRMIPMEKETAVRAFGGQKCPRCGSTNTEQVSAGSWFCGDCDRKFILYKSNLI